jgi:hypothetical protein
MILSPTRKCFLAGLFVNSKISSHQINVDGESLVQLF